MSLREWVEQIRMRRRLRSRSPGWFDARGGDPMPTAGADLCTAEIDRVTGGGIGVRDLDAFLVRDPRNLTDGNAIVVQSKDARRLGYLRQEAAATYAGALDRLGADARVRATVSRASPASAWNLVLYVDLGLLDELREAVGGRPPGDPRD